MKKKLLLIGAAFLTLAQVHAALVATNAINLQAIASTTINGITNSVAGIVLPTRNYLIQNSGIAGQTAATNGLYSLTVNVQASFDGVNWTTIGTYHPSSTNSTVDTYSPVVNNLTAYTRVQAITTNTITVGVTSVQNQ